MAGHLIVCGLGRVGYRVVEVLLRLGERVTIITIPAREEWMREVRERGCTVLIGDARDDALLVQAGIREASGLIATTDDDLVNTEIALDARRLNPDVPVVVRIFDQTLAQQLEASFDVRRALSMSALAAPTFAAAALGERVLASFRLEDRLYIIGRIDGEAALRAGDLAGLARQFRMAVLSHERRDADVPEGGSLEADDRLVVLAVSGDWDRFWSDAQEGKAPVKKRPSTLLLIIRAINPRLLTDFVRALWRNSPPPLKSTFIALNLLFLVSVFVFHLGMNLTFLDAFYFMVGTVTGGGYGDINPRAASVGLKLYACLVMILGPAAIAVLYSIITDYIITARFQQMMGRQRIPQEGHFIVAGLGTVGYRVVEKLRLLGAPIVAIERDPQGDFVETVRAHTPVVIGDARLRDTLTKAGAPSAVAVIAVTSDDAANLGACLETRQLNPKARTVVRLFDARFARKVKSALGIDVAIGAYRIGAPTFAASVLYPDVRTAFIVEDRLGVVMDRTIGTPPATTTAENDTRIVMRRAAGESEYRPVAGDAALVAGDRVIAVVWRPLSKSRAEDLSESGENRE